MKAVLIRVGLDSQNGGNVGPIFRDGSFEFVPIPEFNESDEERRYSNTKGKSGLLLSLFVGNRFKNMKIHFDPEYDTFTYGDYLKKSRIFGKLMKGDYLIFYAGLRPYENTLHPKGLYIIGYFCVDNIYRYEEISHNNIKEELKNNAHIKRGEIDEKLVIVKGNPSKSKLLKKAIRISKGGSIHWVASDQFCETMGRKNNYNLLRSSPRVIENSYAENLINFIIGFEKE